MSEDIKDDMIVKIEKNAKMCPSSGLNHYGSAFCPHCGEDVKPEMGLIQIHELRDLDDFGCISGRVHRVASQAVYGTCVTLNDLRETVESGSTDDIFLSAMFRVISGFAGDRMEQIEQRVAKAKGLSSRVISPSSSSGLILPVKR